MKAGADLDERRDPPIDGDTATGRRGDTRQELEQRALAGTVAADDADRCASRHIEGNVFQCPEAARVAAGAESILLSEALDSDVDRRHTTSAMVRSAYLKYTYDAG